MGGTEGIPDEWKDPVGDAIVLHKFTRNLDCMGTVGQLTQQTAEVATRMVGERSDMACFGDDTRLPDDVISLLSRNEKALLALSRDPQSAITFMQGHEIAFHYGGEPVLHPDVSKVIGVSVKKNDLPVDFNASLNVPEGWVLEPAGDMLGQHRFLLRAGDVPNRSTISVTVRVGGQTVEAEFIMLGPGEAKNYHCGQNVPTCPKCHARIEACICDDRKTGS